ncbi:Phosphotransferase enzyme family protein [Rosistilla oblonga]|uniref:phosphotransferase n=1 Tax=Rosistilla oblonga TaxID=2527990 RepID=UPI0011886EF7|nr:phosphotransferase [Rosistilla oblonga]QDV11309.1 Phosphotransferase enzyme family protein [Rosistilla oblonga]
MNCTLEQFAASAGGPLGCQVTATQYSFNSEPHGAVNLFIADETGPRFVLKRARDSKLHAVLVDRNKELSECLAAERCNDVSGQLVTGRVVEYLHKSWICFPFVFGKNAMRRCRLDWSGRYLDSTFETCLRLCQALSVSAVTHDVALDFCKQANASFNESFDETSTNRYIATLKHTSLPVAPTHNDMSADNFLDDGVRLYLIDWEYWCMAPAIFNFFDLLMHFHSVVSAGYFRRRKIADYTSTFLRENCLETQFWKSFRLSFQQSEFGTLDRKQLSALFTSYLQTKACNQWRTYQSHYSYDRSWKQIFDVWQGVEQEQSPLWNILGSESPIATR